MAALADREADSAVLAYLDFVLDASQKTATAHIYYTARSRHSARLYIKLDRDDDFDSRITTLLRERPNRLEHIQIHLVPKPVNPELRKG